jgi:hypothetical protein
MRRARHVRPWAGLVLATIALAAVACQGQPARLLTDPKEILLAAASTTASAKSVHVDLAVDGPVQFNPFGNGAGAALDLKGTTASADVDLAANKVRATFASPQLMNIAGELIALDDTAYLKSTLTGPNYLSQHVAAPGGSSPAPSANPLAGLSDLLSRTDLAPVKGDDFPCAGGTCYTVTLHLTLDDLAALGGTTGGPIPSLPTLPGLPLPSLTDASAEVVVHVEQASTRLSGIDATLHLGDLGTPHVVATFTKWNEAVTIAAPPPEQVQAMP